MRYKIQKKSYISNDKICDTYYVLYEKKLWWKKTPVWKHCREFTYASYDTFSGEAVQRSTIQEAEDYINSQMKKQNGDLDPVDIKIYECRDSKLNKILN